MNRRELFLGTLLAPLIKPLAKLLPATTVRNLVPGNLPRPIIYSAVDPGVDLLSCLRIPAQEWEEYRNGYDRVILREATRRMNAQIEDDIID